MAVVALVLSSAACETRIVNGKARPPSAVVHTSTTTTAPPKPTSLPVAAAAGKLLKLSELEPIVNDTGLTPIATADKAEYPDSENFDPSECASRLIAGDSVLYGATQAFHGEQDRGARGQVVTQVVAVVEDDDSAQFTVDMAQASWTSDDCPQGTVLTTKGPEGEFQWSTGDYTLADNGSRISTVSNRQQAPTRACGHVVAAKVNAVVETVLCGDGDTLAAANQIADKILATIP